MRLRVVNKCNGNKSDEVITLLTYYIFPCYMKVIDTLMIDKHLFNYNWKTYTVLLSS